MELADTLPVDQRLRLAVASASERVRFCCAYVTVAGGVAAHALSSDDEAALSELLVKVAEDPDEFRKWMAAFNTYPVRYPALHRPLGYALARAPLEAAIIYIDSITLHPIRVTDVDKGRNLISGCLRVFGHEAPPAFRQIVWERAYQRWLDWRFGAADPDTHLFDINRSPIDFAVVSYICERMSVADRNRTIAEIKETMTEIALAWRQSESECITEWNRLLSIFQPYAHAYSVSEVGRDILSDSGIYYPFDISASLYHRIMFRIPAHAAPSTPT